MSREPKRPYGRRIAGLVARTIALGPLFVVALAVAVAIHLDTPATRRAVAAQLNDLLRETFRGQVRVARIGHLSLGGVSNVDVRARDPDGIRVLRADNVAVTIDSSALARSLFAGNGPIFVDLGRVSVGHADVDVDANSAGQLRLATTFAAHETEASGGEASERPGRSVVIRAPRINLSHAWIHGQPPGAPLVDADLFDAAAQANVDGSNVHAKLDRLHFVTRSLPLAIDPRGSLSGSFESPSETGRGVAVVASFDGELGGNAMNLQAQLVNRRLDARVEVSGARRADGAELGRQGSFQLHAEAHGTLPYVSVRALGRLGDATAALDADVATEPSLKLDGSVRARSVDLAALMGGPRSRLGFDAAANVTLADDGPRGDLRGALLPGLIDERNVPRVDVQAHFAGRSARARMQVRDAAMPAEIAIEVTPRRGRGDARLISARVRANVPDLRRVPVVGKSTSGSARIEASARLLLPEQTVPAAELRLEGTDLSAPGIAARQAALRATASGTIDRPSVNVEARVRGLSTGSLALARLDARSQIERRGHRLVLRDVAVDARRPEGEVVSITAKRVVMEDGSVRLDDGDDRGVGETIRADVTVERDENLGLVDAPRIDVSKVALFAGHGGLATGNVALRADGSFRQGVARGRVHADLSDISVHQVKHAAATIDGAVDDRELELHIDADTRSAGRIRLSTQGVRLAHRIDDPRAWLGATGKVVVFGEVDLGKYSSLVPAELLPIADLRGRLTAQGTLSRDADVPPSAQLHVHTKGLVIAAPSRTPEHAANIEIVGPAAWRSTDVDVAFDFRNDGRSGLTDVAFRIDDRHGNAFAADAKVIAPYAEILRQPTSARALIFEAPMHVRATIPPRRLEELPSILGLRRTSGELRAELDVVGTVLDPRATFVAQGKKLRLTDRALAIDPDVDATLKYDGRGLDLAAKVASNGCDLLDVTSHADASTRDLILRGGALPWSASGRIAFHDFPLEVLPQATDLRVRGRMTGEVTLDDLHRNARARATLDLVDLAIDKARYPRGLVRVDASNGNLTGRVRFDQTDGLVDVTATTGLRWGSDVVPTLDDNHPIDAKLVAIGFRAAALAPFVEGTLPDLDGRIDANVGARIIPGRPGAELAGTAHFHDGSMHVAALGSELRSVRAVATLRPDGTIQVTDIFARGGAGELRGEASAKLDGANLVEAKASLRIPERQPFDVSVEGVPFGQLAGRVNVEAKRTPEGTTEIEVDTPRLTLELPRATRTDLQSLTPNDEIFVGVYRDKKRFTLLPLSRKDIGSHDGEEAAETHLTINIRLRNVEVTRGNNLQIMLSGRPRVEIEGDATKVFGEVTVDRGWLDLQGKRFEIEKGVVTFDGSEPPDPVLMATAGWTAADGTRVLADFLGPLSTGKLTLRSEPPRPKNEVLALIVFGTADGANPAPTPAGATTATTKAAIGLGGGLVAQGLTEALDYLTGLQATARIDTTQANNPRPEVEIQLSPRITLGFAHVLGTPPITEPDKNFATFDYRFHKNWSLQTRFGDRGTALVDSLWQKRY